MTAACASLAVCLSLALLVPTLARADPSRPALIIVASGGAALPRLPACDGAEDRLAARLGEDGFRVERLSAPSNGEFGAALGRFAAAANGAAAAVLAFCGYGEAFGTRLFLLPSTARVEQPGDLLTEGVLAGAAAAALGHAAAGALWLDLYQRPGGRSVDLAGIRELPRAASVGIAASFATEAASPAPVASQAAALWHDGAMDWPALGAALSASGATVIPPLDRAPPIGAQAAPPPEPPLASRSSQAADATPQAPASAPPVAPEPAPPASTAAEPAAPPPRGGPITPAPPPPASPVLHRVASTAPRPPEEPPGTVDENTISMPDRLRLQAALAARGDFNGRVDGFFRPSSRRAIRRFQAALGHAATGWLTEAEAAALLAPAR